MDAKLRKKMTNLFGGRDCDYLDKNYISKFSPNGLVHLEKFLNEVVNRWSSFGTLSEALRKNWETFWKYQSSQERGDPHVPGRVGEVNYAILLEMYGELDIPIPEEFQFQT